MRWTLILLPVLLGSALAQDGETPAAAPAAVARIDDVALFDSLEAARQDLVISRTEFKRCAKVEQDVLRHAREVVYRKTPLGQAMPIALSATADLMAAAAAKAEPPVARLCTDMAASYRAMARELDGREPWLGEALRARKPAERAADAFAQAKEAFLAPCGDPHPEAEDSWSIIRRGDPQFRALARNMQALRGAWATLDVATGCAEKACDDAAKCDGCDKKAGEGTDAPGCCATKAPLARAKELVARLEAAFADVKTERPPPDPPTVPT